MKAPSYHQPYEEIYLLIDRITYLLYHCIIFLLQLIPTFSLSFNIHLGLTPIHNLVRLNLCIITIIYLYLYLASLTILYLYTIPTKVSLNTYYIYEFNASRVLQYKMFYINTLYQLMSPNSKRLNSKLSHIKLFTEILSNVSKLKLKLNTLKHIYLLKILRALYIAHDNKHIDYFNVKNG